MATTTTMTFRLCGMTQTYPQEVDPKGANSLHLKCRELIDAEASLTAVSLAEKVASIFDDSRGVLDVLSMEYLVDKDEKVIDPLTLKNELTTLKEDLSKVTEIFTSDKSLELFKSAGAVIGFLNISKSDNVNYYVMCSTLRERVKCFESYLK